MLQTTARAPGERTERAGLAELVEAVRGAVAGHTDWSRTAESVAAAMRGSLPGPGILTDDERIGHPDHHQSHTLYVEADGSFSVTALVWRPGQATRIHDHVTWCVFGVLQGVEHEQLFDTDLRMIAENDNRLGEVSGFAPPGDIHRVFNNGDITAISMHVYGTDIERIGSSVRRYYD